MHPGIPFLSTTDFCVIRCTLLHFEISTISSHFSCRFLVPVLRSVEYVVRFISSVNIILVWGRINIVEHRISRSALTRCRIIFLGMWRKIKATRWWNFRIRLLELFLQTPSSFYALCIATVLYTGVCFPISL
jgi:hypothetical protein